MSGQTTQQLEGAKVQDESLRSRRPKRGDWEGKTKQHEPTMERLAKVRTLSTTTRWRPGERAWGAQRCAKVGWEADR